jgi:hypothetical protein
MGPWKQLQSMFQPARYMSTLIYFGAMGGTLYAALSVPGALSRSIVPGFPSYSPPACVATPKQLHNTGLTLIMVIIQFGAALWYEISHAAVSLTSVEVELTSNIFSFQLLQVWRFLRSLLPAVPDGHRSNRAAPLIADGIHHWRTGEDESGHVHGINRTATGKERNGW